jgi:predicted secreted hydrolase
MQPPFAPPFPVAASRSKRRMLQAASLALLGSASPSTRALPERSLSFPRDHGAHPDLSTEWWYLTGHASSTGGRAWGFQVTFFRSRVPGTQTMRSAFAAKQLIFAHCAITDVQGKKLHHDQRIARQGFDLAQASELDTDVKLRGWTLQRGASAQYQARIQASDFAIALDCAPTQPLLLQGNQGLSRKGPEAEQASYYYSQPQLAARGRIRLQGASFELQGTAWLDHEWSQELLHPSAVGWDWIGMNLFDGSSVMAFQLRDKEGNAVWDGGVFRTAKGQRFRFLKGEVVFSRQRSWKSPTSQATYPIEWIVRTPADFYTVKAVIPNQELDSRASTGAIYWEGLSDLFDSNGNHVGRGYLEMTGYARPLNI